MRGGLNSSTNFYSSNSILIAQTYHSIHLIHQFIDLAQQYTLYYETVPVISSRPDNVRCPTGLNVPIQPTYNAKDYKMDEGILKARKANTFDELKILT